VILCDAPEGAEELGNRDGIIVFAPNFMEDSRVSVPPAVSDGPLTR